MIITKMFVVEYRYPVILNFPDDNVIADLQNIVDEYTNHKIEPGVIEFYHKDQCRKIGISTNKAVIALENMDDLKLFDAEYNRFNNIVEKLHIKRFTRLGIRNFFIYPVLNKTLQDSKIDLAKYQFNNDKLPINILNSISDFPESDFAIVLEQHQNNKGINFKYGIVDKNEVATKYSFFKYQYDPEIGLFFDIDNYLLTDVYCPMKRGQILEIFETNKKYFENFVKNWAI